MERCGPRLLLRMGFSEIRPVEDDHNDVTKARPCGCMQGSTARGICSVDSCEVLPAKDCHRHLPKTRRCCPVQRSSAVAVAVDGIHLSETGMAQDRKRLTDVVRLDRKQQLTEVLW